MTMIENELRQAFSDNGQTASGVLEWVRERPKTELYRRLEWDDAIAGDRYRLSQVRALIRVYHVETSDPHPIRAIISVPTGGADRRNYHSRATLMTDELRRLMVLQDALKRHVGELESLGFREAVPIIAKIRDELALLAARIIEVEETAEEVETVPTKRGDKKLLAETTVIATRGRKGGRPRATAPR